MALFGDDIILQQCCSEWHYFENDIIDKQISWRLDYLQTPKMFPNPLHPLIQSKIEPTSKDSNNA